MIENRHRQDVRIFKSDVLNDGTANEAIYQVTISANETREFSITFIGPKHKQRIEAKDLSGKVVFSQDYKMTDLENMGWKITIPP